MADSGVWGIVGGEMRFEKPRTRKGLSAQAILGKVFQVCCHSLSPGRTDLAELMVLKELNRASVFVCASPLRW